MQSLLGGADNNINLARNTYELAAGLEFKVCKNLLLSAGVQYTDFGITNQYTSDLNFNNDSFMTGLGGKYSINENWDINAGFSIGFTYYIKKRHWDRCLPGKAPVYNINQTIIMPEQSNDCPEYGTMVFYVFFPNNYSGRNDAPTIVDAPVNAIDYLASGFHTQTKFDNADAVAKHLSMNQSLVRLRTSDISVDEDEVMGSGYEMSDTPISLSMDAGSCTLEVLEAAVEKR